MPKFKRQNELYLPTSMDLIAPPEPKDDRPKEEQGGVWVLKDGIWVQE